MNSKQILDVHQMQHLQELGLDTSNASICWIKDTEGNQHLSVYDEYCYEASFMNPIPAYTLQDVLDALPKSLKIGKSKYEISIYMIEGKWAVDYYSETDADIQSLECENLIDAVYSRLCWAIEHKFAETNKNE